MHIHDALCAKSRLPTAKGGNYAAAWRRGFRSRYRLLNLFRKAGEKLFSFLEVSDVVTYARGCSSLK